MSEASGRELPDDLRFHYRKYARLLVERERVRRTHQADETVQVETWRWVKKCIVVTRWGETRVRPHDELRPGDKETGERTRDPYSTDVWGVLRPAALGDALTKTERARAFSEFCARYPLGKEPQTAAITCREYLEALETAIDLTCDPIAQLSREHGLPVPWGEGNPRAPRTPAEYESICRFLRDRAPDPEEGVAAILDSVVLPPNHLGPTQGQQKASHEAQAAKQEKKIDRFDVTFGGRVYRPLRQFAEGHLASFGDAEVFEKALDAFEHFVRERFRKLTGEQKESIRVPSQSKGKRHPRFAYFLSWLEECLGEWTSSCRLG